MTLVINLVADVSNITKKLKMKCQCQLHQCCCFKNSKVASLASGIYTAIISAFGLVTVIVIWSISEFHPTSKYYFIAVYAVSLIFSILFLLSSLLLVYAVIKKKRLVLIPWMVLLMIVMLFQACLIVFFLSLIFEMWDLVFLLPIAVNLSLLPFHIVCLVVVITYYRSLRVPQRTEEEMEKFSQDCYARPDCKDTISA